MSDRRYLILHAGDETGELRDLHLHLKPLSRQATLEVRALDELTDCSDEALDDLLKGCSAVLLCLSAPLLALDCVLDDRIRAMVGGGLVEVVLHRPCAHKLVPWIRDLKTIPRDGGLFRDLQQPQRDIELTELTYRLAEIVVAEAAAPIGDEAAAVAAAVDTELPSEVEPEVVAVDAVEADEPAPEPEAAEMATVEVEAVDAEPAPAEDKTEEEAQDAPEVEVAEAVEAPVVAAGPGAEKKSQTVEAEQQDDDACRQFDETCEAVLPADQPMGDEAIEALVELSVYLGAAREEIGDQIGAGLVYRHAVERLVEVLEMRGGKNHKVTRFSRVTRLAFKQALKDVENGKDAVETLRTQLEKALARAPQQA